VTAREIVVKFFDKEYEKLSFKELCRAPVSAISGVSESDAADIKKSFGIDTVEELATNNYVLMAQGINALSKHSAKILDKEFESKEFGELRERPVSALSGISEADATLLKKAFGVDTVRELAENKYVKIAQLLTAIVRLESLSARFRQ